MLLEAKDPRVSGAELLRGTVLFLFADTAVDAQARLSVQIDETTVRVLPGAQSLEGRPVAVIQAPFAAWRAYSSAPTAEGREGISFFGELRLLQSLSAVARAKRSTVSARLFDLAPAATKSETKTRRKRQNHVH